MPFERESVEHCFMNSPNLAMQTPIVSHTNHSDAHLERLIGDLPSDQFGQPTEPGDALPINPSMLVPTMLTTYIISRRGLLLDALLRSAVF